MKELPRETAEDDGSCTGRPDWLRRRQKLGCPSAYPGEHAMALARASWEESGT